MNVGNGQPYCLNLLNNGTAVWLDGLNQIMWRSA